MTNMRTSLALALAAWMLNPSVMLADRGGHNPGGNPGRPGWGGGPGHNPGGPGGPGHNPGGPGGPGHNPGGPGGPGHNPGGPGGPGHNPGGPGGPGHNPGGPGWGHPGGPGWGHRPPNWRPPHRPGWRPPHYIPSPPPPQPEYLCQGNFTGVFGSDRDAWLGISTDGRGYLTGDLFFEGGAEFSVSGSCNQIGNYAEVSLSVNGGSPYEGRIYFGDDGRIYMEGYQPGTPVTFAFVRD